MGQRHINHTLTSNEGCKIHIDGDVTYSVFPPSIDGFSGTITMSGGAGCPHGKLTFGIANPGGNGNSSGQDISMKMDDHNIYKMKEIHWEKNLESVPNLLNIRAINNVLLAEFQSLELDMKKEYEELKNSHNNCSVNINVNCT